ncbi:MAG: two-component system, NtrC family, sensor kinase [Actinoplanes sp.]|nr:two-component system, NtrC family, sensor kinase [Actinoplanes sp.]
MQTAETGRRGEPDRTALTQVIDEQRRTIQALIAGAERRTAGLPDTATIATWQRNLTLQRRLSERTDRLEVAEQLIRSVIDSIDAGLCILDANGQIIDTNQMWRLMLGWAGCTRRSDGSLADLADGSAPSLAFLLHEAAAAGQAVLAGGPAVAGDNRHIDTDGEQQWWRVRVDPVHGTGAGCAVVTLADTTQQVHTQEELRQATRDASRLALVARHMDAGVMIADADGVVEWVNDAFTQMSGYTAAEAVGQTRTALLGSDQLAQIDLDALTAGPIVMPDLECRTKHGRRQWLRVELYRVVDDDGIVRLMGVEHDVTAARRAEWARLAATARAEALARELSVEKAVLTGVISSIPHLIYWKDALGRYGGHNGAFLAMRGLDGQTDLLGQPDGPAGAHDELGRILADLEAEVLRTGEAAVDHHVTVPGPDGTARNVLMSVLPQPDAVGQVGGVIGIGADVTRIGDLERQLNQANRLEAIGQLAAGIAHEINTPIQFVSDNTSFVAKAFDQLLTLVRAVREMPPMDGLRELFGEVDVDFLIDEVPSALTESLEGLERVAQIVRAMKDFSHPGQGRADVDVNRAVESTAQVARNEWKYHAQLDLRLGADVGLIPCYEGELKQVVLNLIVNAAHAIEAAGPRPDGSLGHISIGTTRVAGMVHIVIRDDGIGMDEATSQRIFDPFFTTKEVGKGTGQGLSMAYASVVQKHGGAIRVESSPGNGTAFVVSLPAQVAAP